MPLYTFYPRGHGGCTSTWLCAELEDDREALIYAKGALATHPSAAQVTVCEGDREVAQVSRSALSSQDEQVIRGSRERISDSLALLAQTADVRQIRED